MPIAFTLVLAFALSARANLLVNGSVEEGTFNTDADGWLLSIGDTFRETQPVFGYTDGPYPEGGFALKQFGGNGDLYQTNIPVMGRLPYDVRGWFYHSSTEDVITNDVLSTRMFLHVDWYTESGTLLQSDYTTNHNGTVPADLWTPIAAIFTAPHGASRATFHVESDSNVGGGSVFGDDFFFEPQNLLANPSLESGEGTTNVTGWIASAGDCVRDTTNAFGYRDGPFRDGQFALKEFGGGADLQQGGIPVFSGFSYTASAWFLHGIIEDQIAQDPLSTRSFLHLEWFDTNNAALRHDYSDNHNGTSLAGVWTPLVLQVISPTNAAWATFHVESDSDVGGGSVFGDAFYFAREQVPEFVELPTGLLLLVH